MMVQDSPVLTHTYGKYEGNNAMVVWAYGPLDT
jgi:hypothetical protein